MDQYQLTNLAWIVFGILNVSLSIAGSMSADLESLVQLIGAVLLIGGGTGALFFSDQSTGEMMNSRLLVVLSWGGVVLFVVGMILGYV
jgi:hypothetical protein